MKANLRQTAGSLLPPPLYKAAAVAVHRLLGNATVFAGRYATWPDAAAVASGYDAAEILERTRAAILKVKTDPTVFERDSVILPQPEYSFPALAALLWVAGRHQGKLDVTDFGGSLGSSFFQFRRFLAHVDPLHWAVVEQSHFVHCGNEEITEGGLTFHAHIMDVLRTMRPDLFIASSVLQYLPDPAVFINELIKFSYHRRSTRRPTPPGSSTKRAFSPDLPRLTSWSTHSTAGTACTWPEGIPTTADFSFNDLLYAHEPCLRQPGLWWTLSP